MTTLYDEVLIAETEARTKLILSKARLTNAKAEELERLNDRVE